MFKSLSKIASALEYQNLLLSIIAGHLTGQQIPPKPDEPVLIDKIKDEKFDAKLSIYNDERAFEYEQWTSEFNTVNGRQPTEDEVEQFNRR
jgi:hypothetical protein